MVIYLPCKLGGHFTEQKFKEWKDGKKVYVEGSERVFKGFGAFDCITRCLAIPIIYTDGDFLSYDPLGEFSQRYVPKYKIFVDVKTEYKLSDRGFPSGKTGRLYGISVENGCLVADFVTNDRYEHLRYAIKDNLQYAELNEETIESLIEYNAEPRKSIKALIKTKIKRVESEEVKNANRIT